MPRILLIGPIEDRGGRELETGFVASVLNKFSDLDVLSTGNITIRSQVYEMEASVKMRSLKQLLYKRYPFLRPAAVLSYLKNKRKEPVYFYVNNKVNSKFLKQRENDILQDVLKDYDLVFIIAHLQTLRTREIIEISNTLRIPLVFRTTGEIHSKDISISLHKKVDLFIHHSVNNTNTLHKVLACDNYAIIDQNSYMEEELLELPIIEKKVSKFITVARLAPEKNLSNLISFFHEFSDKHDELIIVGMGKLYSELLDKVKDMENIKLLGHVSIEDLKEIYRNMECAIIPAYTEAGPLVGIDAMAAGKIILSTKVGAMPERLAHTYNDFWFEAEDKNSFKEQFSRIKNLEPPEVRRISAKNREVYLERYSKHAVSEQYSVAVSKILEKNKK